MKNNSYKKIFAILVLLQLVACSSFKKKQEESAQQNTNSVEGTNLTQNAEILPNVKLSEESKIQLNFEYNLVIGPGLARTISILEIFKGLEEKKIKINSITSTEWSSLWSAIYSLEGVNKLEWELFKFNSKNYQDSWLGVGILNKNENKGKAFYSYLNKILKDKEVKNGKIPLFFSSEIISSDLRSEVQLEQNGLVRDLCRGSFSFQEVIKPYSFNGLTHQSSLSVDPLPSKAVKELISKGVLVGKILCIDFITSGYRSSLPTEHEQRISSIMQPVSRLIESSFEACDEKIILQLSGTPYLELENKAEIVEKGREAFLNWYKNILGGQSQ
jgi:hypothetical protein